MKCHELRDGQFLFFVKHSFTISLTELFCYTICLSFCSSLLYSCHNNLHCNYSVSKQSFSFGKYMPRSVHSESAQQDTINSWFILLQLPFNQAFMDKWERVFFFQFNHVYKNRWCGLFRIRVFFVANQKLVDAGFRGN